MVCDRVAILVQGVCRRRGRIEELTADSRRYEIEVALPQNGAETDARRLLPEALREVAQLPAGFPLMVAPPPPLRHQSWVLPRSQQPRRRSRRRQPRRSRARCAAIFPL